MVNRNNDAATTTKTIAVIAAKFNAEIVDKLLAGAVATLRDQGVPDEAVEVYRVPGAFELPFLAKSLAQTNRYAAVICLGAVIRGDTDHYDYVCQAATHGILQAGMETGVPVIFGVLTCDTDEQATERAGGAQGNKGADAAMAALAMTQLVRSTAVRNASQ
jgi:6,7-dimethyl-8-ribityllumazine synthase